MSLIATGGQAVECYSAVTIRVMIQGLRIGQELLFLSCVLIFYFRFEPCMAFCSAQF